MEVFSERVPPHSDEAEQSVLGAMLIDRDAIARVHSLLTAADFYADRHRLIYQAMTALFDRGEAVDLVTVTDEIRESGRAQQVGGISYLAELANMVPTTANVESYAQIVAEKATLRRLQAAARQIVEDAYVAEDLDLTLAAAEKAIFDVTQRRAARGYEHLRGALVSAYGYIEHLYTQRGETTGVPTGFQDLDRLTSGLQPSDLVIVAARPSIGKTAFCLNIARNAAINAGSTVLIFSLEMAREQLAMRLLAAESAVDSQRLRTGHLEDEDWHRLSGALARLSEASIYIDDTPNIPLLELRARARRLQAEHRLDLVIIDYMQLMQLQGRGRNDNRQQEIAEISRSLKALARELKAPVMALSQLSRAVEQRQDKRPMLSDLRESGAIEQDADVVMFLYRDDYYDTETEKRNICEVNIAKQRNGPTGHIELYFLKEIGKFLGLERRRP